ncbi:hypothetical protein Pmani_014389 [Petrolisthes manimaculis]|uniref:HTH psq-type domain-containing protein n=1 Tax=Petrolisthes manimaculis TaxID=1843537 RepID=A0AAE1PUG5_9EUCA|nr:hypothetical protein Pmani_014389 [Petrolisthes manimaculis]
MSGKRSGVGGRFKATPPDDNPKVAAIVGEKDEEEIESENDIVVSESETSDRVLRKVVVTDTTAKTDGVNDRNPTTSTTTSTSGPKTRATRLRDDAAIVAAAAVVTTKRNRKQQRDLDLKNSSDEENDVTNIDETPPADDDDDDSETDDADETCFKIDKVYSVSDEHNDLEMTVTTEGESGKQKVGGEDLKDDRKGRGGGVGGSGGVTTPTAVISGVKLVDAAKLKEEKQIKPRIQATATLAKLPAGLGGGVGSVRMLGAGVRGTNMPFIVSMGAGNPGIPLLPAGLPPGRYVILPGSSTTTSKTATVTTMAASGLTTRLATTATGHPTIVTAQKAISAASTTSGTATATPTPTPTPSPQQVAVTTAVAAGGGRLYTRERGRRKSYTTGEKLAMIEAVEGGQRKSVVADRFGVAPSTLACILAQRHKIRSEKDNLARRRVRHTRYQELREDMVGGGVISSSAASISSVSPPHQPFTHFLAPLTSPTPPTFLDTQPEEIIAGMLLIH